jgi:biotin synthase-like enzyme
MKQHLSIENITIQCGSGIYFVIYKTGGCPEDCGYCPQAARYHTSVGNDLMTVSQAQALRAKSGGSSVVGSTCPKTQWFTN